MSQILQMASPGLCHVFKILTSERIVIISIFSILCNSLCFFFFSCRIHRRSDGQLYRGDLVLGGEPVIGRRAHVPVLSHQPKDEAEEAVTRGRSVRCRSLCSSRVSAVVSTAIVISQTYEIQSARKWFSSAMWRWFCLRMLLD